MAREPGELEDWRGTRGPEPWARAQGVQRRLGCQEGTGLHSAQWSVLSSPKAKGQLQRDSSRRHGVVMLCVLSTVTRARRFTRNYGIAEAIETAQ